MPNPHPHPVPMAAAASLSTLGSDSQGLLAPPVSSIFNRQRSGSAPSPIKVVRDSHDLSAYNITVTPRTSGSNGSTPTTGDSDIIRQTFPETPSAFSPAFSPGTIPSPGMQRGSGFTGDYMSMAVPQTPMSAFLPAGVSIQPSLAQQVLLTRAATSVHGARHSRQTSLSRLMRATGHPYARPSSIVHSVQPLPGDANDVSEAEITNQPTPTPPEAPAGHDVSAASVDAASKSDVKLVTADKGKGEPAKEAILEPEEQNTSSETNVPSLPSQSPPSVNQVVVEAPFVSTIGSSTLPEPIESYGEPLPTPSVSSHTSNPSNESLSVYGGIASVRSQSPSVISSGTSSKSVNKRSSGSHLGSTESLNPRVKTLPRIPPAPQNAPPAPPQDTRLTSSSDIPSSSDNSSLNPTGTPAPMHPVDPVNVPLPPVSHSDPMQTPTPVITPIISSSAPTIPPPPSLRRPSMISPPSPRTQLQPSQLSNSSVYSLPYDASPSRPPGSPPSYYSVINSDRAAAEAVTPSTSASYDPNYRFGCTPHSPPLNGGDSSSSNNDTVSQLGQGHPSTNHRRTRARPPLPAGPRRPSQQHGPASFAAISVMRERGGSISSLASNMPSGRRLLPGPLPSPKFQAPTPKWRGYTMEAAKWTFTSTQLQAVVSRAIKQSSEASSIRLLRLETLDNEIPEEMERLQTQRTDAKAKYKTLARRRANLLETLADCVDGLERDGPVRAIRLVEDLKDMSATLDKLTEELHSLDEQIAQVTQLCQAHSSSALAMALRKLNASFLKQFAEAQSLRKQVESLEAERDEAWKQAEDVANDYDDLRTGKVETPNTENRFSRVTAVRKSSLRAAKAGLHRVSQRASVGNSGKNTPLSARSNSYVEEIPPVPPIPRRRPVDIMTNIPPRSSMVRFLFLQIGIPLFIF